MNKWLFASGILSLLLMLVHVFLGGPEIHDPVLGSTLNPRVIAVLSVVWHGITVVMLVNGVLLLAAAYRPYLVIGVVWVVIGQYGGFALLFIFYGLSHLGNLMAMPQWVAFTIIAGCVAMGMRRAGKQNAITGVTV
ncbi:hypothetical protein SAMN04488518_103243 [Pseudovibrio ascidiaceicola]|uniref:DUF4383 domain-containing protein n=1 Tax=Pseudovibrio ascidiaceicola TaxID=285279 RepID=A0A1I3XZ51_9HYPH|nr:hypothetical protein [Pseudovibrio ascidiaceicola]SFK24844.1 hypothetical protein SAMN04488518_103243 [Pseudovibrio ascidiaceicola]